MYETMYFCETEIEYVQACAQSVFPMKKKLGQTEVNLHGYLLKLTILLQNCRKWIWPILMYYL